mgnify:FL=1
MVTFTQLLSPIWQFESLVNEQHLSSRFYEVACEVDEATSLEVEVVAADVKALV